VGGSGGEEEMSLFKVWSILRGGWVGGRSEFLSILFLGSMCPSRSHGFFFGLIHHLIHGCTDTEDFGFGSLLEITADEDLIQNVIRFVEVEDDIQFTDLRKRGMTWVGKRDYISKVTIQDLNK
jgi:hypothetical protein